jgi:hypothetical protein
LARYIATWRGRTTARAALGGHFRAVDAIELAHRALDLVDRDAAAVGREDIGQLLFGQLQAHRLAGELGKGDKLVEAADQFADVAVDRAGEEFDHVLGHLGAGEARQAVFQDLAAQLDVGSLYIGDEPHRQAREQALFHPVERLGRTIGRHHQALAALSSASMVCRNSSCVLALPMMNWISSTSSMSKPRRRS